MWGSVVSTIGLVMDAGAAFFLAGSLIVSKREAVERGVMTIRSGDMDQDARLPFPSALLRDATRAKVALYVMGAGFGCQLVGAWLP